MLFAVPSEASTRGLFCGADHPGSGALETAQRSPVSRKLLRYLLPTAVGVVLFVTPLAVAMDPGLRPWMAPFAGDHSWLVLVSLVFILFGRLITMLAAWQLRSCARRGDQSLQVTGLFRRSRNPILVGLYLFYAGNCIWLPSAVTWGGFSLYVWAMHHRVLMEEGLLLARFKGEYLAYFERVPRYVGVLRRAPEHR